MQRLLINFRNNQMMLHNDKQSNLVSSAAILLAFSRVRSFSSGLSKEASFSISLLNTISLSPKHSISTLQITPYIWRTWLKRWLFFSGVNIGFIRIRNISFNVSSLSMSHVYWSSSWVYSRFRSGHSLIIALWSNLIGIKIERLIFSTVYILIINKLTTYDLK